MQFLQHCSFPIWTFRLLVYFFQYLLNFSRDFATLWLYEVWPSKTVAEPGVFDFSARPAFPALGAWNEFRFWNLLIESKNKLFKNQKGRRHFRIRGFQAIFVKLNRWRATVSQQPIQVIRYIEFSCIFNILYRRGVHDQALKIINIAEVCTTRIKKQLIDLTNNFVILCLFNWKIRQLFGIETENFIV